jgi:hypothetical protein
MTQLSRLATLGMIKEVTPGTYLAPSVYIPFTKADYEDVTTPLKDTSYRANDSVLQGLYPGPIEADWSIDLLAYPDLIGHFLRGVVGPDTVTAGASTTQTGSSIVGDTTLNVTSATGIVVGTYLSLDTAGLQEYVYVSAVAGTVLTVTTVKGSAVGMTKAHTTAAVVAQTTHTFKQNPAIARPSYSLSVFDTTAGAPATLGYTYATFSDVQLKIDPKATVSLTTKLKAQQGVQQSTITPVFTALAPLLGWQWTMTNAGASSTRGLTLDMTIKRQIEAIHSSNGIQSPREIFQGALEVDATYKAIFENTVDLLLFQNYVQTPTTATLLQPASAGGASLALTMSQSGWQKGKREFGSVYVEASYSLSGIYNATDTGSLSAVLKNFITTTY